MVSLGSVEGGSRASLGVWVELGSVLGLGLGWVQGGFRVGYRLSLGFMAGTFKVQGCPQPPDRNQPLKHKH